MLVFLTVQSLSLFHHDKYGSDSQTEHQQYQAYHKSEDDVAEDETHDGAANGSCRPVDVPSLKAEKLQRTLQSLEERKVGIAVGITCLYHSCLRLYLLNTQRMNNHIFSHLRLTADAEEQRQSLCCSNEENTCSDDHHDLLFHVLLLIVHRDVNADCAHYGNYAGNGVTELHDDGDILGNFLRNAQYLYKSLIYSMDFRV